MISIIARPHPFSPVPVSAQAEPGSTLAEILGAGARTNLHVAVDGETVDRDRWPDFIPPDESQVVITVVPEGVDTAAYIAALAYAAGVSGTIMGIGTAALIGIVGAAIVNVGISMAISMALNAIVAPQAPKPSSSVSFTPSRYAAISGGSNAINRFGPLPRLYGTFRFHPPLAANYYSVVRADSQYFKILLFLSYGRIQVGSHMVGGPSDVKVTQATGLPVGTIRIGETSISRYTGVSYEIGRFDQITLFKRNVAEQGFSVLLGLQSTWGEAGWYADGNSSIRTTEPNTVAIEIDVGFQSLIAIGKMGQEYAVQVDFKVETRLVGAPSWSVDVPSWIITGQTKEAVRRTLNLGAKAAGQYEVRLTRVRTWVVAREVLYADCYWTALRSTQSDGVNQKAWKLAKTCTLMALEIKATGQLSGMIDSINVLASSVLPVWNGTDWVDAKTANPAWCFADAIRGEQLSDPIPDSMIDTAGLLSWATACDVGGLEYNWYHQDAETLLDRVRAISTTGRAAWALVDRKFGVVRDLPGTPVQLITPRNAMSLDCTRSFVDLPHAVRVQYIDSTKWTQAERVVVDDGYAYDGKDAFGNASANPEATKFEEIQTQGVTSSDQAWKEGRYFLAALRLRPETWRVRMDAENLVATRGDTVRLAYDTIAVGSAYGRIKSISGSPSVLVVDTACTMLAGHSYGVRIRKSDGSQVTASVVLAVGDQTSLTLGSSLTGVSAGDLFAFGESSVESVEAIIKTIEYDEDLAATLTLVPAAPGIHSAYTGTIPAYDPAVTQPVELLRPSSPLIILANLRADLGMVDSDGASTYALSLTWSQPAGDIPIGGYDVRWIDSNDTLDPTNDPTEHVTNVSGDQTSYTVRGIPPNTDVIVSVRAMSVWGRWSDWCDPLTVVGAGQKLPPDVTTFSLGYAFALRNDGTVDTRLTFTWTAGGTVLNRGYELLYKADDEADWRSVRLGPDATTYQIEARQGRTYSAQIRSVGPSNLAGNWAIATPLAVPTYTTAPSAPTGITAIGDWRLIRLTWTNPAAADFAGVEIWENTSNNSGTATLIATVGGSSYSRTGLGSTVTRWYWLKAFNRSGNRSSFSSGASATTLTETSEILDQIAGQITETQLSTALGGRITGLENAAYWLQHEAGEQAAQLLAEAETRSAGIAQEVADRIAAITGEATARTSADSALESRLFFLEHETGANTAFIIDEQYIRQSADSAEVTARQTLSSKLTGLTDPSSATLASLTSGLIYDERTLRQTTDDSLATQISLLTAGVAGGFDPAQMYYFDSSVEGWTATGTTLSAAGGWLLFGTMTANGVIYLSADFTALSGAQFAVIGCRIKRTAGSGWTGKAEYKLSGAGGFSTNYKTLADPGLAVGSTATVQWDMSALTVGGTDWITHDIVNIRLTLGATSADKFEIDWIGIGRNAPGASMSALLAEQTARATADSAETTARQALSTKLTGAADPSGLTLATLSSGLVYDERQARSSETGALATSITTLQADMATAQSDIGAEQTARAAADAASALDRYWQAAEIGDVNAGLIEERTVRASADSALSSQITTLTADVASNAALITTEQTARANADTAEATARQGLSTKITGAADPSSLTLATLSAGLIYDERTTRSSETSALSTSVSSLSATVSGHTAIISSLSGAQATTESARAWSDYWTTAEIGQNTAQVQVHTESIAGLSAQWTAKIDVNGYVAGFGLASATLNGTPVSTFLVRADRFAITNGTNPRNAFSSPSLTRSGTTATLNYLGHGLTTGDRIEIRGVTVQSGDATTAYPGGWNGTWKVTVVDANNVTFTVPNTLSTPATTTTIMDWTRVVSPFTVLTATDAFGNPPGVYMDKAVIKNADIDTLQIAHNAVVIPEYLAYVGGYVLMNAASGLATFGATGFQELVLTETDTAVTRQVTFTGYIQNSDTAIGYETLTFYLYVNGFAWRSSIIQCVDVGYTATPSRRPITLTWVIDTTANSAYTLKAGVAWSNCVPNKISVTGEYLMSIAGKR